MLRFISIYNYILTLLLDDVPESGPEISVQVTQADNMWDKRHACKFCGQLYLKVARRLETCHGNEPEGSPETQEVFGEKRSMGDYP